MMADNRRKIDRRAIFSCGILLLGLAILYVAMVTLVQPIRYDLRVDDPAYVTITATKDVVDELTTQQRRGDARAAVQPNYILDGEKTQLAQDKLIAYFTAIDGARAVYRDYRTAQTQIAKGAAPEEPVPEFPPRARDLEGLRGALGDAGISLQNEDLGAALTAQDSAYNSLRSVVEQLVIATMDEGLHEGEREATLSDLREEISGDGRYSVAEALRPLASSLFINTIEPNYFEDEANTEDRRAAAAEAVEPVTLKKGQNIVIQGELVRENQLAMLEALGLLEQSARPDFMLYVGMGVLLLVLGVLSMVHFRYGDPKEFTPKQALLLVSVILLMAISEIALRQINAYLMPIHFAVMMIAVLFSTRAAIAVNLLCSVLAGVLAAGEGGVFSGTMIEMILVSQIGGLVAALSLRRVQSRTALLLAGLWTGLAGAATMGAIGLMTNLQMETTLINAGYAALSGLISSVMMVGFLPGYEAIFGSMTMQKLLELSNPNQPLLRQLQLEAPGTYHHSLLVANLAEAAALAVGANDLLCRVGAYYHDIGKTKRPVFFKENQLDGNNPHDSMDPRVSATILAEHVRDGRQMAEKAKLPSAIVDIIAQHHGTTSMAYFYFKAKKAAQESGETISEADYRYDGPAPQTKEAAIIALSDTVEAAVRSLKDHSSEAIQGMVKKLIQERLQDGQMAAVDLTLADFSKIEEEFLRVLGGIYHTRVEYPELAANAAGAIAKKGDGNE